MPGLLTVTTASTTAENRLSSLPNIKAAIGMDAGDTSQDTRLTLLLDGASRIIAKHCGRVFAIENLTEIFRSGPQTMLSPFYTRVAPYGTPLDAQRKPLVLTRYPIVAESLSVTCSQGPLVEGTDYEIDYKAGTVDRIFGATLGAWAQTPLTFTYQAGFDLATEIPPDLENVCLSLVAAGYWATGRDQGVASEATQNVGSTSYWQRTAAAMTLDDGMRDLLADYVQRAY